MSGLWGQGSQPKLLISEKVRNFLISKFHGRFISMPGKAITVVDGGKDCSWAFAYTVASHLIKFPAMSILAFTVIKFHSAWNWISRRLKCHEVLRKLTLRTWFCGCSWCFSVCLWGYTDSYFIFHFSMFFARCFNSQWMNAFFWLGWADQPVPDPTSQRTSLEMKSWGDRGYRRNSLTSKSPYINWCMGMT